MDISKLLAAIKVEESNVDAFVYIGYIRICSIYEEEGRWYPKVFIKFKGQGKLFFENIGYATKQDALDAVVKHLTD